MKYFLWNFKVYLFWLKNEMQCEYDGAFVSCWQTLPTKGCCMLRIETLFKLANIKPYLMADWNKKSTNERSLV